MEEKYTMKTNLRSFLTVATFVLFLLSNRGYAQTGEISGKVLDEVQKAFPYVSVSLLNAKDSSSVKGTLTADNGTYEFKNLNTGNYLIAIYAVGYKKIIDGPFSITAQSSPIKAAQKQLFLDAKLLKGVEIVTQKPLIERQIDKTVLNIENSILAVGNTALDILGQAPGVTVDKDGAISLRGKQGVTVMIDGKPTYLSAEQLANVLRATEGSSIKSIELITNPSAKYDAAGNSGIINIKMKKNQSYGMNGSVNVGTGYGYNYKADGGVNMNYRNKKFNLYGNGNYGVNRNFQDTDIWRVNGTKENQTYFDQTSHSEGKWKNLNYKTGIDWFLTDQQTLGFFINGYHGDGENSSNVLTLIGDAPSVTDSAVVAPNQYDGTYTGASYNLNYHGVLDTVGQEINMDMDYSRHIQDRNNFFNTMYKDGAGQPAKPDYRFRSFTPSKVEIYGAKIDYVLPLSKQTKLEMGAKSSFVKADNNFLFENLLAGKWENDLNRSNQFLYEENINAAYGSLKTKYKTTSVQLGIRTEQTRSTGNSITEQKIVKRDYLDFFPSLYLNQELSKDHEAGLSYSRRIDRPNYSSLNPFISYLDIYTYRQGNPFLKPQYTNSFELSYSFKKNLNVSFSYKSTNDVMTEVLLTDTAKKTIFISVQNLAKQKAYNMNTSYVLPITKWWNSNTNLTIFHNQFETPNLLGAAYKSGMMSFNFNTNHTLKVNSSTNLEWTGRVESKQIYGTLLIAPRYRIDLGASRSFMDSKLNVKFAANDIFKLQKSKVTSTLPSQNYVLNERWESQVFRLTCTYRFGSKEIKAARERSGSSETESKRAN